MSLDLLTNDITTTKIETKNPCTIIIKYFTKIMDDIKEHNNPFIVINS
jgi:hypothetical protein